MSAITLESVFLIYLKHRYQNLGDEKTAIRKTFEEVHERNPQFGTQPSEFDAIRQQTQAFFKHLLEEEAVGLNHSSR